ncbi:dTDP-4-amino-4,6-dideoxygalactose transaminase [Halovulum sp. GXIMD14793]
MNVPTEVGLRPVPLSYPDFLGCERAYVTKVIASGALAGPGEESRRCEALINRAIGSNASFLVPSCSAALEMAALLVDLAPGDEVIMPSYTFVSTANAVVLRGAVPVFVDVDAETFNIDPTRIAEAITPKTRAIFVIHYAGVPADMAAITAIARAHDLTVVEDAAQAYLSTRDGLPAGRMSPLSCLSFHGTKNITAGEGGALVVNDPELVHRAAILREKGTDRAAFMAGRVALYKWRDVGSSQVVSELTAAFLRAQLEDARGITDRRLHIWHAYQSALQELAAEGHFRLPSVPDTVSHNAHIYFLNMPDKASRKSLAAHLSDHQIQAATHYVPLHSAPAGRRFGRACGSMHVTDHAGDCLLRLPLHAAMTHELPRIVDAIRSWTTQKR